jgi:hypothetical protein
MRPEFNKLRGNFELKSGLEACFIYFLAVFLRSCVSQAVSYPYSGHLFLCLGGLDGRFG